MPGTRTRFPSSVEVFDMPRFRADVIAHIDRWNMPARRVAEACGVSDNAIYPWLRGTRDTIGLFVACALADVCDLSLDKYRRAA